MPGGRAIAVAAAFRHASLLEVWLVFVVAAGDRVAHVVLCGGAYSAGRGKHHMLGGDNPLP